MSWLAGLAEHLAAAGLGLSWSPTAAYTDGQVGIALEHVPQTPTEVVVLTGYDGAEAASLDTLDSPRVQVRTRSADPETSRARSQAIYDVLHGLSEVTLPDGTELRLMAGVGSGPGYIGADDNNRHEHTTNYDAHLHNPARRGRP